MSMISSPSISPFVPSIWMAVAGEAPEAKLTAASELGTMEERFQSAIAKQAMRGTR